MTIKHQATREEETYGHLLGEIWEKLSEPVRTLIGKAHSAAYTANLVHIFSFQPEQDDEALEEMRLTDAGLTEREREPLAKLWRAALAAASIDPDDFETLAGYRVCRGNLH